MYNMKVAFSKMQQDLDPLHQGANALYAWKITDIGRGHALSDWHSQSAILKRHSLHQTSINSFEYLQGPLQRPSLLSSGISHSACTAVRPTMSDCKQSVCVLLLIAQSSYRDCDGCSGMLFGFVIGMTMPYVHLYVMFSSKYLWH